jgi:hypothetical protein
MQSNNQLRGNFLKQRNSYIAAGEPGIFHCHHYNCYLQAVLLDTCEYLPEVKQILADHAQEISYSQFAKFFQINLHLSVEQKKVIVADYFRFAGFGIIDLSPATAQGGTLQTNSEHYGIGWKSKFGVAKEPVSFFTTGFLAGAIEAIYGLELGTLAGTQESCVAMDDDYSNFTIAAATAPRNLQPSPAEGSFQSGNLPQPADTNIDYSGIREALIQMPIEGSAQDGLIDAFGVLLTRHYANYYCSISYSFLKLFMEKMGENGHQTAATLLVEAGHICAFNTFGGVMQSNEWNAMIKPSIQNQEDWVHGMTAVVNAFGWGFWEIVELDPGKKLVMKISNGYEANAYLKAHQRAEFPVSFLATGGVAGLMNLVYVLDLPNKAPLTLDDAVYKQINKDAHYFTARQLKCRAMGDDYDLIEATVG